ncbi:MAG: LPXTG cell wall anchor domain-containing protein [Nitriliruptorales bacterium]
MRGKHLLVALLLALTPGAAFASEASPQEETKVVICHATDSEQYPYRRLTVPASEVDGEGQNDHTRHTGPVFKAGMKKAGTRWGDIIPPGEWGPGLNWTNDGVVIHSQHCVVRGQPKHDQGLVKLCRVIHDQNGDRTDIHLVEKADKAALEELEEAGYVQYPYTGALPEVCIPVPPSTPPAPPAKVHEHKPKAHHHHNRPQKTETPDDEERLAAPGELPLTGPPAWLPFAGGGLMLAGGALLLARRKWFA